MINTINHIGIGAIKVNETFKFFKNHFGFLIKMNDIEKEIKDPLLNTVSNMRIINCGCPCGGGFLELFQYINAPTSQLGNMNQWRSTGFIGASIEVIGLKRIYQQLQEQKVPFLTKPEKFRLSDNTGVWDMVYLMPPDCFILGLLDKHSAEKIKKPLFYGIHQVTIGVEDLEKAVLFYQEALGFDRIRFQGKVETGPFKAILGNDYAEMVVLERSQGSTSMISSYTGGMIFLIKVKNQSRESHPINRGFGDPGISELGFDVSDIRATYHELIRKGAQPLVEPEDFNWFPGPQGILAYLTDPEGNVLELIETIKMYGMRISTVDKICIRPMLHLVRGRFPA